jgi:tetratricopeptide (TPR) repeat protein
VEQLVASRQAYQQGVETMIKYYIKTGNNMKLNWARSERGSLNAIPQYKYIAEASSGAARTGAAAGPTIDVAKTGEADLAEQLPAIRQAYQQSVETLVKYYTKAGNNIKLKWAQNELSATKAIPQYKYIVEATVAGPNLKAGKTIADADTLYDEAVRTEESGQFLFLKDESRLRQAVDKYNQLINKYPTSDKIDDAAFRAARIYERLGDYKLALLYYQRTYQWDPETTYPARYKAAFIFDRQFHQRDEALNLYQDALKRITRSDEHPRWKVLAEQRVKELSGEVKPTRQ